MNPPGASFVSQYDVIGENILCWSIITIESGSEKQVIMMYLSLLNLLIIANYIFMSIIHYKSSYRPANRQSDRIRIPNFFYPNWD